MPARKNTAHLDKTKERIQTSQLINRLMGHALGKNKMSTTQVQAASILLKKTVPDLQSIEHGGELDATVVHVISDKPMTEGEWSDEYGRDGETVAH